MLATYTKSAMAALLCPWCHATDQDQMCVQGWNAAWPIPRYADVPYAWLTNSASCHCRYGAIGAIPLYYLLILGAESGNFWTHSQPAKIKFAT